MRTVVTALCAALVSSCASYVLPVSSNAPAPQRMAVAGATLSCAADAQKGAMLSLAAASVGTSLGTATLAFLPVEIAVFGYVGVGVFALAATAAAIVFAWTSTQYTDQAGEILAGRARVGGCDAHQAISVAPDTSRRRVEKPAEDDAAKKPRARPRPRTPGMRGERCRDDGSCFGELQCGVSGRCEPLAGSTGAWCDEEMTCNFGLECADHRCQPVPQGALTAPCKVAEDCAEGLECSADRCAAPAGRRVLEPTR